MRPAQILSMQIGKNGLTENIIQALKNAFNMHENVKISVLKTATQDKVKIEQMAFDICQELGKKFTYKIVGHTIFLKKWRRAKRK